MAFMSLCNHSVSKADALYAYINALPSATLDCATSERKLGTGLAGRTPPQELSQLHKKAGVDKKLVIRLRICAGLAYCQPSLNRCAENNNADKAVPI